MMIWMHWVYGIWYIAFDDNEMIVLRCAICVLLIKGISKSYLERLKDMGFYENKRMVLMVLHKGKMDVFYIKKIYMYL